MDLTAIAESHAVWLALAVLWVWIGWRDGYAKGYARALGEAEGLANKAFEKVVGRPRRAAAEPCCAKGTPGCEMHHTLSLRTYECCVVPIEAEHKEARRLLDGRSAPSPLTWDVT